MASSLNLQYMKKDCVLGCLIIALVITSFVPLVTFTESHKRKLHLHDETNASLLAKEKTKETVWIHGDGAPTRTLRHRVLAPSGEGGVAACLLIKDENYRLIEWMAYHYHTLPLRYLVVAVDPTSVTSPSLILDRWRATTGMDIVEWSDTDYYKHPEAFRQNPISRQMWFFPACTKYHREMNRTWVVYHDVDEYVSFNSFAEDELRMLDESQKGRSKVTDLARENEQDLRDPIYVSLRNQRIKARERLPAVGDVTVLDFMNRDRDGSLWRNDTCITMPRLLFSAVESTEEEVSGAHAHRFGFNATQFNTLRFFRHAKKGSFMFNRWGKVIVDVSRLPMSDVKRRKINNPHKPFDVCKQPLVPYETAFLRCNHYTSSWEAYSYKNDYRKTRDEYDKVATVSHGTMYDMQPWLSSFVQAVGYRKAHYLLRFVGDFKTSLFPTKNT